MKHMTVRNVELGVRGERQLGLSRNEWAATVWEDCQKYWGFVRVSRLLSSSGRRGHHWQQQEGGSPKDHTLASCMRRGLELEELPNLLVMIDILVERPCNVPLYITWVPEMPHLFSHIYVLSLSSSLQICTICSPSYVAVPPIPSFIHYETLPQPSPITTSPFASFCAASCSGRSRYAKIPQTPRMASSRSCTLNRSYQRVRHSCGLHQSGLDGGLAGKVPSVRYSRYAAWTRSLRILMWWFKEEMRKTYVSLVSR